MNMKWINVADSLPYDLEDVLVCTLDGRVDIGYKCDKLWYLKGLRGVWTSPKNIIAWMHLPPVYKEEHNLKKKLKQNNRYQDFYFDNGGSCIPMFTDNLAEQQKIESFIFNAFHEGYHKAWSANNIRINHMKYKIKVQYERIRGLEAMLKEQSNGKSNKK